MYRNNPYTLFSSGGGSSDPILELSPTAYYTPNSIDPDVTVDGAALSGNVWEDTSGNDFHATVGGGSFILNIGTTGRQLEWSGSGWLDIPDNTALNFDPQVDDATIIWRMGDTGNTTASGYPVAKAAANTTQRVFGAFFNDIGTYSSVYIGGFAHSILPPIGFPNHLAICVISGGDLNMWIDGLPVVVDSISGTTATLTSESWNIGSRTDGGYTLAGGSTMDLVAICIGTAATAQQIADIEATYKINSF